MSFRAASALVLAAAFSAACSAGSDKNTPPPLVTDSGFNPDISFDVGDDTTPLTDLTLTPSNATIYVDLAASPAKAATLKYTAEITVDGSPVDVTSSVALTVDDPVGTFSGADFTSVTALPGGVRGMTTVVHGTAEGKSGIANLTIVALRKTGDQRDFFFVEPYKGAPTPSRDVLTFGTNIKQLDLAFSVDTTGSMSGAIDNLKTNLSTVIFPALKKKVPSVGLGVVDFKDEGDTWVVKVPQLITSNVTKAQAAASALSASGGGDEPEADICAMMHIVTGKSCSTTPAHTATPGNFGAVEFRPGALPVVVNITDAHWHNPSAGYDLEKDLMPAFKAANVRFVGVTEMHYSSGYTDLEDMTNYLSDYTKSSVAPSAFGAGCATGKCCTGLSGATVDVAGPLKQCRLNFHISNGSGLSDSIVSAISALSVGSVFDVTAVASNDPANADGVDATKFMQGLRAMDEGDAAAGCPKMPAKDTDGDSVLDTFTAVPVGTPVCFEVIPQTNTTVPPKPKAQFFKAFIDVLGMPGAVKLDRREVIFLVPPTDPIAR